MEDSEGAKSPCPNDYIRKVHAGSQVPRVRRLCRTGIGVLPELWASDEGILVNTAEDPGLFAEESKPIEAADLDHTPGNRRRRHRDRSSYSRA